jgi:hypothetical protein
MDSYPPSRQRPRLIELLAALGARADTLRRDECGDWRIKGSRGWIYAVPGSLAKPDCEGFQIVFMPGGEFGEVLKNSSAWTRAKEAMPFADVQNDGDGEGTSFLFRLPSPAKAETIRAKLGIPKKIELSEAELQRRKEQGRRLALLRHEPQCKADLAAPETASQGSPVG